MGQAKQRGSFEERKAQSQKNAVYEIDKKLLEKMVVVVGTHDTEESVAIINELSTAFKSYNNGGVLVLPQDIIVKLSNKYKEIVMENDSDGNCSS